LSRGWCGLCGVYGISLVRSEQGLVRQGSQPFEEVLVRYEKPQIERSATVARMSGQGSCLEEKHEQAT
jgi:hypothetical protein